MDRISQQIEEASRRAALARASEANLAKPGSSPGSVASIAAPVAAGNPVPASLPEGQQLELDFDELRTQCVVNGGQSKFAEVYRILRTRVLQQMRQNGWTTLGVTSPNPQAGKTTTATNLSLAIARDPSYRSILMDCDFRRPGVRHSLMTEPDQGLIDYLSGTAKLSEIIYAAGSSDWRVMFAGPNPYDAPSELLNSDRMRDLLRMIGEEQEQTIAVIDLPPSSVGDDVLALSAQLDAMLVVVEDGSTDERELQNTMALLRDSKILGLVLNKAEKSADFVHSYYG